MANQRNRVIELKDYLLSLGIKVNIAKNKARGHKGVFVHTFNNSRIDISKNLEENEVLSVLLHEFAHYMHYQYDKSLKSLDFIFDEFSDELKEELIKVTVEDVPKSFAESIYGRKEAASGELKSLVSCIKKICPEFKMTSDNKKIEQRIPQPARYLLKYDRVKYLNHVYSIEKLEDFNLSEEETLYIKIKAKQRFIKRCNSKINRVNKYYNNPSELFARFIDSYYTRREYTQKLAPKVSNIIKVSENPFLKDLNKIFSNF